MIEALAQVVCTAIQVEAAERGPSTVFQVQYPSGTTTSLNKLDVRLNAIGFSARQNLVYGVDHDGRVVALDRTGRVVGTPSRPSYLLRHAVAGVVVRERLVVRVGPLLHSVDIDPASPTFGRVVHEAWLWPWPWPALTVDDFDVNPADGLLYGVATYAHGHGVVVTINPRTGEVDKVPGVGLLPGGRGYGAVTFSPDGALYATNNRHDGRSTLWRVALDGSGVVTEISSRQTLHTIDSSGCLSAPPVIDPPRPTPTPTPTPSPTTTTTTTTTTPPTTTTTPPTTTTTPPTTTTTPPPTTTTPPTTTVKATTTPAPTTPPTTSPPPTPPPQTPAPPTLNMPERRAESVASVDNNVRDQRRWGLTAIILILGAGALARQAANRRR